MTDRDPQVPNLDLDPTLRGFVAGKSGVTLYDLRAARADATTIKRYCQGHLTVSLVSAAGQFGR